MRVRGPANINPVRTTATKNSARPTPKAGSDGAELSSSASSLSEAKGPEVIDEARVERLRRAIAQGTFPINADVIAERMLAEES